MHTPFPPVPFRILSKTKTYSGNAIQQKEEEEIQMKAPPSQMKEEEELVQGKAIQKAPEEEEEVQMKESSGDNTQGTTSASSTQSTLPRDVNARMEAAFNRKFLNVNIHTNDSKATQMNALAFTQGNNVHFAPGQYNPHTSKGQELIGHEYTHVVQQDSGQVAPTTQAKGMSINDNPALENEADVMGKKAAEGKEISMYNSPGLGIRNSVRQSKSENGIIQRAVSTWGGEWDTDKYELRKDKDDVGDIYPEDRGVRGVDMKLKFSPGVNADAETIGITQSVNTIKNDSPESLNSTIEDRSITAAESKVVNGENDEGVHIDQSESNRNPMYAVEGAPASDTSLADTDAQMPWGQHGYRYTDLTGTLKTKNAILDDTPTYEGVARNSKQLFEATAVAIAGAQSGAYYGSVKWGWETDNAGAFKKVPLQKISDGVPSSSFMKAAEIWNTTKTEENVDTINLPIVDVKLVANNSITLRRTIPLTNITLPVGTRLQITRPCFPPLLDGEIKVVDGIHSGETGEVSHSEWGNISDERS